MVQKRKANKTIETCSVKLNKNDFDTFIYIVKAQHLYKNNTESLLSIINDFNSKVDKDRDDVVLNFSYLNPYLSTFDKTVNFNISKKVLKFFKENSRDIGVSYADCLRKLMLDYISNNQITVRFQPNSTDNNVFNYGIPLDDKEYSSKLSAYLFKIDSDIFNNFFTLYEKYDKGHDKGASVSDEIMKFTRRVNGGLTFEVERDTICLELSKIYVEDMDCDKKLNIPLSKTRYTEFINTCYSIGIAPTDCIRKLLIKYIKEHSDTTPDDGKIEKQSFMIKTKPVSAK